MGTGLLTPPTRRELNALAVSTGFRPDMLEKAVRLLALADDIAAHPYLGDRLALTGGTALNMFVLAAPRLSIDLDYNYIGAVDRATMKAERPTVEAALADVVVEPSAQRPVPAGECLLARSERTLVPALPQRRRHSRCPVPAVPDQPSSLRRSRRT